MKKCLILFFLISILAIPGVSLGEDGLVVIIHPSNPMQTINKSKLAAFYRGEEIYWPNGERIVLVNLSLNSEAREMFYRKVLKTSPATKYFIKGTMAPIRTIVQKSEAAVKLFVSNMPQAIGYILEKEVDDSVKVLMIDGGKNIP